MKQPLTYETRSPTKISFLRSLWSFLQLSKAGLRISFSERKDIDWAMYRFFWNGYIVSDLADIDRVRINDKHAVFGRYKYNTVFEGGSKPLGPKIKTIRLRPWTRYSLMRKVGYSRSESFEAFWQNSSISKLLKGE